MAQVEMNFKTCTPKCTKHDSSFLPLFCRDCDHLLCSDCITMDHVTHNFCKVSEVAQSHQNDLEMLLKNSASMALLTKMSKQLQMERIHLVDESEKIIRRISKREAEIIQRVKLWSKKMIENIDTQKERRDLSTKHDESVINALLHFEELSTEIENRNIVTTFLHCEVERVLTSEIELMEGQKVSDEFAFEEGPSGEDLDRHFGRLEHHGEQESASDVFNEDDGNKSGSEDESTFYECYETSSRLYQTCTNVPVDDIVVFHEHRIFILSNGTLFHCDTDNSDNELSQRVFERNVNRIAQIPSTEELLYVDHDQKTIYRLSKRNKKTRFLFTKNKNETFCAVNTGGTGAYACIMVKFFGTIRDFKTFRDGYQYFIYLLDEFGVTLKRLSYSSEAQSNVEPAIAQWRVLNTQVSNQYIVLRLDRLHNLVKFETESGKKILTYSGSIGVNPWSQFSPSDMAIDDKDNVLLVVKDDNAIHLLDKSFKFQRLILTEEDGLESPCSVTLDGDGYLWVGCKNGKILVFNYQYLLRTERGARAH